MHAEPDRHPPMIQTTWSRSYDVNTMVVNPQKRLGLVGLLNILQDIAWIHGSHLGHGFEAMLARGSAWVLTRQEVTAVLNRMSGVYSLLAHPAVQKAVAELTAS